jgi:hypothetical protein
MGFQGEYRSFEGPMPDFGHRLGGDVHSWKNNNGFDLTRKQPKLAETWR